MSWHVTYCRVCQASCGVLAEVQNNQVVKVVGDPQNPMSGGFTCPKGRRSGDLLSSKHRLTTSLERGENGDLTPIDALEATGKVAARLTSIIDEHGPDAVGIFLGTQGIFSALTNQMARAWFRGTRSHKLFSTMTIDQSAKWVVNGRMGEYLGGRQAFGESQVWILAGTNPLISVNGGAGDGVLMQNPSVALRDARKRGLKLIVIDPRATETALHADLHLRPRPGTDALLFAGLLNIILSRDLHDAEFCAGHVAGLDELRRVVAAATPTLVEERTGVPSEDLERVAVMFADGPRGMISTGTGVCMGPYSNLAEHLAMSLNVICGRFQREGEPVTGNAVMGRDPDSRAEVRPPNRTWEAGYRSRLGAGLLYGELPTATLPDEILEPGPDRIRALVVSGGNPVLAMPGAAKALRAFSSLELLVTIDPGVSETAQVADYVIAPTMSYERADHTLTMEKYFAKPYAMYTDAIVEPPPGVIEDWRFFWHLARAMGQPMTFEGHELDMSAEPTSQQLLELRASAGRVPFSEVAAEAHGHLAPPLDKLVLPPRDSARAHRLEILPADVEEEVAEMLSAPGPGKGEFLLTVRRMRELMNGVGRDIPRLPRQPYNPAFMHPDDLARTGVVDASPVRLTSRHGAITATARADRSVLPGTVSISHLWSPSDTEAQEEYLAVNVNVLTGPDSHTQTINHMRVQTAVSIRVESAG